VARPTTLILSLSAYTIGFLQSPRTGTWPALHSTLSLSSVLSCAAGQLLTPPFFAASHLCLWPLFHTVSPSSSFPPFCGGSTSGNPKRKLIYLAWPVRHFLALFATVSRIQPATIRSPRCAATPGLAPVFLPSSRPRSRASSTRWMINPRSRLPPPLYAFHFCRLLNTFWRPSTLIPRNKIRSFPRLYGEGDSLQR